MASGKLPGDTPLRARVEPSPTERRIGPYRILRELGQGGMGTVYLAARADEQFQKRVALKVIRSGADSAEVVRRFKRERQILAGLDHPNIAKLLDGGTTDDGLPYLVLEHIEGEPLLAYCDSRALAVSERLKVFQSICSAVQYAHRNLVVHRDIKPGNVLVDADGSPRLLDFGIAKLLNPELAGEAPTATALAMTPEYASPEQVRGEHITTATDVYSLGVVLYELLTGHHPYRLASRQPLDVLQAVVEQEPERPSTAVERTEERTAAIGTQPSRVTPESVARTREGSPERLKRRLRGDLDNILMAALRKEPHRRYPSVEAFSDDVRRYLTGLPVKARKPTMAYRTGKFMRRHAAGVIAAAAGVFLLIGFAVAMAVQSARVARERDLAQRERATAQRERETAQRVSAFLVDLFRVSDPGEARGNTVTAREVLDKGAAKIATELKDQPEVQATLMQTMGTVYKNLGLYGMAIQLSREALATRKAVFGSDHVEVARSLTSLAGVLSDHGDYAEAEDLYRQALAMRRKMLGNDHADVAASLRGLANVLYLKGDGAGAEALSRESIALWRKLRGNEHADVAVGLSFLGTVLYAKGEYAEAEDLMRQALAIHRKLLGNEHPEVARGLNNLANVVSEKGDHAAADALHREAVLVARKVFGPQHPRLAVALVSHAETLCRLKKAGEAEAAARAALDIFNKALPAGHPNIAETESVLGAGLTLSRRFAEAERLLLRSFPVLEARTGRQSPQARNALRRMVALYDAWGRPDRAAAYRADLAARAAGNR